MPICQFQFVCSQTWDALTPTTDTQVHFCQACQQHVQRVDDQLSLQAITDDRCIAIFENNQFMQLGLPDGYWEATITIHPQTPNAQQLYALRQFFRQIYTFSELKNMLQNGFSYQDETDNKASSERKCLELQQMGIQADITFRHIK